MAKKIPEKVHLDVIFRSEPEGGFTVLVPALPGCVTYGKDLSEARQMAHEAITLYLEDMLAEGEKLPQDTQTYLTNTEVQLPSSKQTVHA